MKIIHHVQGLKLDWISTSVYNEFMVMQNFCRLILTECQLLSTNIVHISFIFIEIFKSGRTKPVVKVCLKISEYVESQMAYGNSTKMKPELENLFFL